MPKQLNNKKGFTIIEVVLVLAIGGMIFLMVFLGFPALRRSSNDNQRFRDLSRLQNALAKYQENNRGALPDATTTPITIKGRTEADPSASRGTWGYFYDKYLLVNSAGNTDTFNDPDGSAYSLYIAKCTESTTASPSGAKDCDGGEIIQRSETTFDKQSKDLVTNGDHSIAIILQATCEGERLVYSSGERNAAIAYKLEGGGTKCINL